MTGRRETTFYFISRIIVKASESQQAGCKASMSAPAPLQQSLGKAEDRNSCLDLAAAPPDFHQQSEEKPISSAVPQTPQSLQSHSNTPRQRSVTGERVSALFTPTSTLDQLYHCWYLQGRTVCSGSNPPAVGKQGTVTGRDASTQDLSGSKPQRSSAKWD